MRKTLWACGAAAVLGAAVNYLVIDYACDHPNSWLGRCFFKAHEAALTQVRAVAATSQAAEFAFHGIQGLFGKGTGAVCEEGDKCPAHPAHEEPAAGEGCPMKPAVLPGGVVMHEDEGVRPAQPMPPVRDLVGEPRLFGAAEDCEELLMPPVPEDAAKMPRVEKSEEAGLRPVTNHSCANDGSDGPLGPTPRDWNGDNMQMRGFSGEPSAAMPGCKDEETHAQSCPCPHHCCPAHTTHKIEGKGSAGGSEECEPVFPKMQRDGGETPKHPDVDTMEVRPSDLWFLDLTGPF